MRYYYFARMKLKKFLQRAFIAGSFLLFLCNICKKSSHAECEDRFLFINGEGKIVIYEYEKDRFIDLGVKVKYGLAFDMFPDGNRVLIGISKGNELESLGIAELNIPDKSINYIIEVNYRIFMISISPSGKKAVIIGIDSKRQNRGFILDTDTKEIHFLNLNGLSIGNAIWSPEGDKIVFLASQESSDIPKDDGDLYIMNLKNNEIKRILKNFPAASLPVTFLRSYYLKSNYIPLIMVKKNSTELYFLDENGNINNASIKNCVHAIFNKEETKYLCLNNKENKMIIYKYPENLPISHIEYSPLIMLFQNFKWCSIKNAAWSHSGDIILFSFFCGPYDINSNPFALYLGAVNEQTGEFKFIEGEHPFMFSRIIPIPCRNE